MYIKELTNEEFSDFTSNFPYKSFYQTPEYAFVMNHEKNDAFFIGLVDDNYTLAASLIVVEKRNGFKYAYTPRGFLHFLLRRKLHRNEQGKDIYFQIEH